MLDPTKIWSEYHKDVEGELLHRSFLLTREAETMKSREFPPSRMIFESEAKKSARLAAESLVKESKERAEEIYEFFDLPEPEYGMIILARIALYMPDASGRTIIKTFQTALGYTGGWFREIRYDFVGPRHVDWRLDKARLKYPRWVTQEVQISEEGPHKFSPWNGRTTPIDASAPLYQNVLHRELDF